MPNLAENNSCTGCSACFNICPHKAITMDENTEGFVMPSIDSTICVECKLCEKACPIVNGEKDNLKNPNPLNTFAFWSNLDRTRSSSGGAFSAIASIILKRKGKVYGASWVNGFTCKHVSIDSYDEMSKLRGSKYVQSSIESIFKSIKTDLNGGIDVLFTGTPCQVAGLKSYLMKPYDNLTCVDIVCHGVPSNRLFLNYINKLIKQNPKLLGANGFEFRKLNAWGYAPGIKLSKFKTKYLYGVDDLYMEAFSKGAIFRESCYNCQFNGINRVGDLTIADFWGIGKFGKPFRHDVTKGVSLLIVNNEKGARIVDNIKHTEDCFMEERPLDEAFKLNHNITKSTIRPANRDKIIAAFNSPDKSLTDTNIEFNLIGNNWKSKVYGYIKSCGLLFPLKSIFNKIMMWK